MKNLLLFLSMSFTFLNAAKAEIGSAISVYQWKECEKNAQCVTVRYGCYGQDAVNKAHLTAAQSYFWSEHGNPAEMDCVTPTSENGLLSPPQTPLCEQERCRLLPVE